jgi:hypothetical protein
MEMILKGCEKVVSCKNGLKWSKSSQKHPKKHPKTPKNTQKLTLFRLSWPAEKTISPVTALTRRRVAVAVAVAVRGSQGPAYLKKGQISSKMGGN